MRPAAVSLAGTPQTRLPASSRTPLSAATPKTSNVQSSAPAVTPKKLADKLETVTDADLEDAVTGGKDDALTTDAGVATPAVTATPSTAQVAAAAALTSSAAAPELTPRTSTTTTTVALKKAVLSTPKSLEELLTRPSRTPYSSFLGLPPSSSGKMFSSKKASKSQQLAPSLIHPLDNIAPSSSFDLTFRGGDGRATPYRGPLSAMNPKVWSTKGQGPERPLDEDSDGGEATSTPRRRGKKHEEKKSEESARKSKGDRRSGQKNGPDTNDLGSTQKRDNSSSLAPTESPSEPSSTFLTPNFVPPKITKVGFDDLDSDPPTSSDDSSSAPASPCDSDEDFDPTVNQGGRTLTAGRIEDLLSYLQDDDDDDHDGDSRGGARATHHHHHHHHRKTPQHKSDIPALHPKTSRSSFAHSASLPPGLGRSWDGLEDDDDFGPDFASGAKSTLTSARGNSDLFQDVRSSRSSRNVSHSFIPPPSSPTKRRDKSFSRASASAAATTASAAASRNSSSHSISASSTPLPPLGGVQVAMAGVVPVGFERYKIAKGDDDDDDSERDIRRRTKTGKKKGDEKKDSDDDASSSCSSSSSASDSSDSSSSGGGRRRLKGASARLKHSEEKEGSSSDEGPSRRK